MYVASSLRGCWVKSKSTRLGFLNSLSYVARSFLFLWDRSWEEDRVIIRFRTGWLHCEIVGPAHHVLCKWWWTNRSSAFYCSERRFFLFSAFASFFYSSPNFANASEFPRIWSCTSNWIMLLVTMAKLRKATDSFVVSVCLTLSAWNNRLPLDGFSWNLVFGIFRMCWEKFQFNP